MVNGKQKSLKAKGIKKSKLRREINNLANYTRDIETTHFTELCFPHIKRESHSTGNSSIRHTKDD